MRSTLRIVTSALALTILASFQIASADDSKPDVTSGSSSRPIIFTGTCRGFVDGQTVGIVEEPQDIIEKLVEGEDYIPCKAKPKSAEDIRIREACPAGHACEIEGVFRVEDEDAYITEIRSIHSRPGWRGKCYGKIIHIGDGVYTVGTVNVPKSSGSAVPVTCGFYLVPITQKILDACPLGSRCEVSARFAKKPSTKVAGSTAYVGYVDHVKLRRALKAN